MTAAEWEWLRTSVLKELEFRGLAVEYAYTQDPALPKEQTMQVCEVYQKRTISFQD